MLEAVSDKGLCQIKFAEPVISLDSKSLSKINTALSVEAFAYDYSTDDYVKPVGLKWECEKLEGI